MTTITCPRCGATGIEPCRTPRGRLITSHLERRRATTTKTTTHVQAPTTPDPTPTATCHPARTLLNLAIDYAWNTSWLPSTAYPEGPSTPRPAVSIEVNRDTRTVRATWVHNGNGWQWLGGHTTGPEGRRRITDHNARDIIRTRNPIR